MKTKIIFTIILSFLMCNTVLAQNITNTLGSTGTFTIKDGSTNYFTLSQSTGQVNILRSLRLENTTSSTTGIIYKAGNRFIHNYGNSNLFMGQNSGNFYLTGSLNTTLGINTLTSNTSGSENVAIGVLSLHQNTTGYGNTAVGTSSLETNGTGYLNTSVGSYSLFFNSTGRENTAVGSNSLSSNSIGYQNTAVGSSTLLNNSIGRENTAVGSNSLLSNSTGSENSSYGYSSLHNNTQGFYNSAFGFRSLFNNTIGIGNSAFGYASLGNMTGYDNTAIGYASGINITIGSNNTAIGSNTQVPYGTSSNQVRIGNELVTYAGIQVAWTVTSDRNLKSNIFSSNLGLGFITKLRPVSYTRKNDENAKTEYGLIAQEVEEVLLQEGAENTGMLTVTDKGEYQLRYNDLIAPMIKAIQELNEKSEIKNTEISKLKSENDELKKKIESLESVEDRLAKLEMYIIEQNNIKEVHSETNSTVNQ